MKRMRQCVRLTAIGIALIGGIAQAFAGGGQASIPAKNNFAMARLLDAGDRPLAGATIRPIGVSTGPSLSWGAVPPGFPKQVLSDTNGDFNLSREEPFLRIQVHIEASKVGSGDLWLDSGRQLTVIHLGPYETKMPPMPRPAMAGGPAFPRGPRPFTPGAPPNWTNGPAHPGTMSRSTSLAAPGEITVRLCPFPPGQSNALSAAAVRRLRLAGQVRTRSGEPLPSGLQVHVRTGVLMEHVEPDSEGRFAFSGLPPGEVSVGTEPGMSVTHSGEGKPEWTGWRLASSNRSRTHFMPRSELVGLLEQDKEDLLLVIEPARLPFGASNANPMPAQPQKGTLWGAEISGPPLITLSGRVVDDRTGQAIKGVKVIPSHEQPAPAQSATPQNLLKRTLDTFKMKPAGKAGQVFQDEADEQISPDGTFRVEFVPSSLLPMLRIEAAGYASLETEPWAQTTSNLVIRLKAGAGPTGIVLRPDGQPAARASVVCTTGNALAQLQGRKVRGFGENQAQQMAGPDGSFAFEPGLLPGTVTAADASGWAEARAEGTDVALKLQLKAWAAVKGTLVTTNGLPAGGMVLELSWPGESSGGVTRITALQRTTTDVHGGFQFLDVPPRRLELERIAVLPGSNFGPRYKQTWVEPEPGVTNDLGQVTCDPPPSLLDTLKQKLGL